MASSFFNSNNVPEVCLQKKLAALHATGAYIFTRVAASWMQITRVAASRMQIVPTWPLVACNMNKLKEIYMRLVATRVQLACNWLPLRYS